MMKGTSFRCIPRFTWKVQRQYSLRWTWIRRISPPYSTLVTFAFTSQPSFFSSLVAIYRIQQSSEGARFLLSFIVDQDARCRKPRAVAPNVDIQKHLSSTPWESCVIWSWIQSDFIVAATGVGYNLTMATEGCVFQPQVSNYDEPSGDPEQFRKCFSSSYIWSWVRPGLGHNHVRG